MCCIFRLLAFCVDGCHKLILCILVTVSACCIILTAALAILAGIGLGYNYSLSEYLDQKGTNLSLKIQRGIQPKLLREAVPESAPAAARGLRYGYHEDEEEKVVTVPPVFDIVPQARAGGPAKGNIGADLLRRLTTKKPYYRPPLKSEDVEEFKKMFDAKDMARYPMRSNERLPIYLRKKPGETKDVPEKKFESESVSATHGFTPPYLTENIMSTVEVFAPDEKEYHPEDLIDYDKEYEERLNKLDVQGPNPELPLSEQVREFEENRPFYEDSKYYGNTTFNERYRRGEVEKPFDLIADPEFMRRKRKNMRLFF